jgi:hypothetical protein
MTTSFLFEYVYFLQGEMKNFFPKGQPNLQMNPVTYLCKLVTRYFDVLTSARLQGQCPVFQIKFDIDTPIHDLKNKLMEIHTFTQTRQFDDQDLLKKTYDSDLKTIFEQQETTNKELICLIATKVIRENSFIIDDLFKAMLAKFQAQFTALLAQPNFLHGALKMDAAKHQTELAALCEQLMLPAARSSARIQQ